MLAATHIHVGIANAKCLDLDIVLANIREVSKVIYGPINRST